MKTQSLLPNCGQPKLEFSGAESDDITIPEQGGLDGPTVDGDQSVRCRCEGNALLRVKFERQMLIPNAIVIQLQVISRRASDTKGKMAGNELADRLFTREDEELNH
jgi:hypothetical protein